MQILAWVYIVIPFVLMIAVFVPPVGKISWEAVVLMLGMWGLGNALLIAGHSP